MDHYLQNDAAKKSFLKKGVLVLIMLALIFAAFMARFALSGSRTDFLNGVPHGDDAYVMAKKFIRPTIKASNVVFPESGYQCAQKPDSVFVVKSYAEAKDQPGPKSITPFEITLKFSGGKVQDKNNWKILGIIED
ncbi:MAG: hypothetical protein ACHQHN_17605 [Sphingobacteriales bacterium]